MMTRAKYETLRHRLATAQEKLPKIDGFEFDVDGDLLVIDPEDSENVSCTITADRIDDLLEMLAAWCGRTLSPKRGSR